MGSLSSEDSVNRAEGTSQQLEEALREGLCPAIRNHAAVELFIRNRAKFEGWMKVELCKVLVDRGWVVSPEEPIPHSTQRVDLKAGDWWLELKTLSTNYGAVGAYHESSRPITRNVQDVIADVRKLRKHTLSPAAVLFVAAPLPNMEHEAWSLWNRQLERVRTELGGNAILREFSLDFPAMPGRLYFAPT